MLLNLIPLDIWGDLANFFSTILSPFYYAVSWILMAFHAFFSLFLDPNAGSTWALSIVLLTMLIRSILIPLFVKQINSSRNMQLLQPKIRALQEKYGSDRERLGQETMKLYKEEGVNPAASCLPILCQMPIFFSLFWVLRDVSVGEYKGVFTDNHPLADSLRSSELFGARISGTFISGFSNGFSLDSWGADQTLALVLIVCMVVALFITQLQLMRKNMPPEALTGPMAQQQKMMLYMFPLIYAVGGISIPIGVLIYWLTTNLWTMGQQYVLIHNNPAPNTPAYIDWEERMIAKGKDPDEIIAKRRAKRVKRTPEQNSDPNKVARQTTGRPDPRKRPRPTSTTTRSASSTARPASQAKRKKPAGDKADFENYPADAEPSQVQDSKPATGKRKPVQAKKSVQSSPASPDSPARADEEAAKKVVKRQQPPRQSRAKRKKSN
jgi:YidC/Oxa1 family membrane protein insertase